MIAYLRQLNFLSMLLRIFLSMMVGGLIGLERERKKRGAGFRTYMLVALGASLTVILGQYFSIMLDSSWASAADIVGAKTDVSRFGAQVINGVGFLGAGTIVVTSKNEVKGLTTAAGLWTSACMGLATGAGFYECVLICFVLVLTIMRFLPAIEEFFLLHSKNMNVNVELDSFNKINGVISSLKKNNIHIYSVDMDNEGHSKFIQSSAILSLRLPKGKTHDEIITMISSLDGVMTTDEI